MSQHLRDSGNKNSDLPARTPLLIVSLLRGIFSRVILSRPTLVCCVLLLVFFHALTPAKVKSRENEWASGYIQEMMSLGKQQMVFQTESSMHRRVEAARVWNVPDKVLENVPERSRFAPETTFHLLKAALYFNADRFNKASQTLAQVSPPFNDHQLDILHRYSLLPSTVIDDRKLPSYFQASIGRQISLLEQAKTESPFRLYLLGRKYWKKEAYARSIEYFKKFKNRESKKTFLREEALLYEVSGLFHLGNYQEAERLLEGFHRSYKVRLETEDESRRRFIDVEGNWTTGTPLVNYLEHWLEAIRNERVDWWYEVLGHSNVQLPYYRFFNTHYSNEPLGRFIAERFRQRTGADFAAINHKGMRAGLDKGPVRRNELLLVLPWNNEVETVFLTKSKRTKDGQDSHEHEKSLKKLLEETFFRLRFSLGTGDPLSYSKSISTNDDLLNRVRFPIEFGDTASFSTSGYVMGRLDTYPLGVLQKLPGSTTLTDRDVLVEYLREKSPVKMTAVPLETDLPPVPLTSLEPSEISENVQFSLLNSKMIALQIQFFLMVLLGLAILISLIRHWRKAINYWAWGLFFGGILVVGHVALVPWLMAFTAFGQTDLPNYFFYFMMGFGVVFTFITTLLFTIMGFYYAEKLELPAVPFLKREGFDLRQRWLRPVLWTLGLTAVLVTFSAGLFGFVDPTIPERIKDSPFRGLFVEFYDNQHMVILLVNFLIVAFSEEITYRLGVQNFLGYAFKLGKERYYLAIWITAGLWSLGHMGNLDPSWVKFVQIFPLGLGLGYLYRHYGLESCIACHGLFNVAMIMLGPYLISF